MNKYTDPAIFDAIPLSLRRFLLPLYRFCWGTFGDVLIIAVFALSLTSLFSYFFIF